MSFLTYRLNEKLIKLSSSYIDQSHPVTKNGVMFDLYSFAFKLNFRSILATRPKEDSLNIGIVFSGGLGDQIISTQWVNVFLERLANANCNFYSVLCFPDLKIGEMIVQGMPNINLVENHKYFKSHKFDILLNVDYFVKFWEYNREAVVKFAPKLASDFEYSFEYLKKYSTYGYYYYHFQLMSLCLSKGLNRYDLLGDNRLCHFDRNSKPYFFVDASRVQETLSKFNLQDKVFITLHSGVGNVPAYGLKQGEDFIQAKQNATRVIPKILAEDIFESLKAKFPEIVLVQIGEPDGLEFEGSDLCLIGKTSLKESLDLVYAAAVHIDNDSGLIHVRHAMNKRSVVLWGPTAGAFVGYPEDENLQGDCKPCMWLSFDWNLKCPRNNDCAKCMTSHKAIDVVASVERLLVP